MGGFYFNTTAELCQRWHQVGAFYPFSRNHNAADMIPQHPTVFGEEVIKSTIDALNIRYSILPYIYTHLYQVNLQGGTIFRALSHQYPADPETWNIHSQFLLGTALLVTPVLHQGATTVSGYFPQEHRWFDFRQGTEMTGARGKVTLLDAPMDYIPLHAGGGIIIPMQEPDVTTVASRKNSMSLKVFPDDMDQASGQLYWDDGEQRYVAENYTMISFTYNQGDLSILVDHAALDLQEVDNLFFTSIQIMGVANTPGGVMVNAASVQFTYDSAASRVDVSNISLSLRDNHTVKLL